MKLKPQTIKNISTYAIFVYLEQELIQYDTWQDLSQCFPKTRFASDTTARARYVVHVSCDNPHQKILQYHINKYIVKHITYNLYSFKLKQVM